MGTQSKPNGCMAIMAICLVITISLLACAVGYIFYTQFYLPTQNPGEDHPKETTTPNQTDEPGNNQTEPGNNQTEPGNNQTEPGNNQTEPGNHETEPGNNQTEPHTHTWGEWTVTTAPTCTELGEQSRSCACGEEETTSVSATGHTFDAWTVFKNATCTEKGEERRNCENCEYYESKDIAAPGHTYTSVVTPPTCTEQGYTTYTCSCGDSYVDNYVNATGHSFSEWETTKDATCVELGEQERSCACGEIESQSIDAMGHTEGEWIIDVDAICNKNGSKHQICSVCEATIKTEVITAPGHLYTGEGVSGDCQTPVVIIFTCEECGYSYSKTTTPISATIDRWGYSMSSSGNTHTLISVVYEVKATGGYGELQYKYEVLASATNSTVLGSQDYSTKTTYGFSNSTIPGQYSISNRVLRITIKDNYGNETKYEILIGVFAEDDSFIVDGETIKHHVDGEWITDSDPTCTENGSKHQVCSVCLATLKTGTIDATGHNYSSVVTGPTCTNQGYTTYTCHCGYSYIDNYVAANGHDYAAAITPPTCTQKGYTTYTCKCGYSYIDNYVDASEHTDINDDNFCDVCENLVPGLYDANNNLIASWNELVTTYGMEATENYTSDQYVNSPYYVLTKNKNLAVGVHLVIGNIESIGDYAFDGCSNLTNITISNSVTSIGMHAFSFCRRLASVIIPDSVEYIGYGAFDNCSNLTSITIGSSVKYIGSYAFTSCNKLVEVYNRSSLNIQKGSLSYGYVGANAKNIYTPSSGESKLWTTEDGFIFYEDLDDRCLMGYIGYEINITLPANCHGKNYYIHSYAFVSCTGLTGVVISDGVTKIEGSAFEGCYNLLSVTIGKNVTYIVNGAFHSCYKLLEVCNLSSLAIYAGDLENGSVGYYAKKIYTSSSWESKLWTTEDGFIFYEDESTYGGTRFLVGYTGSEPEITLPESCHGKKYDIYKYAFSNCTRLTSVTITDNIKSIGSNAFEFCGNITSITIPNSVTSIGAGAFRSCRSLTSITIPNSVTLVNSNVFLYCTSLTSVTIPNSVTRIGSGAFESCRSLTSITIPNSVTIIYNSAFRDCRSLTSITIPNSVTSIGQSEFEGCTSLTSVTIPDSVTSIGNRAFYNCTSLTSITIPNGVTNIQNETFYNCTSLENIFIPDTVRDIGYLTFDYCTSLTSIVIPNSVINIGRAAFGDCSNLKTVFYVGNSEQWDNITKAEYNTPLTSAALYFYSEAQPTEEGNYWHYVDGVPTIWEIEVPLSPGLYDANDNLIASWDELVNTYGMDATKAYTEATVLSKTTSLTYILRNNQTLSSGVKLVIGDVDAIGAYAFCYCTRLTSITISDSVTSIGNGAFYGCDGLTSVTIGNSVTSIGSNAFEDCRYLTSITISEGVTSIGHYAFSSCGSLTSITIPDSVTSIGTGAFYGCGGLTSVTIPDNVTSIGSSAFYGCGGLTSVIIGNSVASIGNRAFYNCTSLTSITIGNSVTSIGKEAFSTCYNLTEVHTTDIAAWCAIGFDDSFANPLHYAKNLYLNGELVTMLVIPDSVTSIGAFAFEYCENLTSVTIGNSVTSIGSRAFSNCVNITSVTIGNSVTSIGSRAFMSCDNLESVTIGKSVTNIGDYAFYVCNHLKNITYNGTIAQCQSITKGADWNYFVPATYIQCSDGTVALK